MRHSTTVPRQSVAEQASKDAEADGPMHQSSTSSSKAIELAGVCASMSVKGVGQMG